MKSNIMGSIAQYLSLLILFFAFCVIDVVLYLDIPIFSIFNVLISVIMFTKMKNGSEALREKNISKEEKLVYSFIMVAIIIVGSYVNVQYLFSLIYSLKSGIDVSELELFILFTLVFLAQFVGLSIIVIKKIHIWFPISFSLSMCMNCWLRVAVPTVTMILMDMLIISVFVECGITLWLNFRKLELDMHNIESHKH